MKKTLANIVSRIFDPVLITPVLMWVIYQVQLEREYTPLFLLLLAAFDLFLPGMFVVLKFLARRMKDWDIKRREARIPLFVFGLLSHLGGLFVTWYFGHMELFAFLFGIWLLLLVYLIVTITYKISVHAGVNTVLAIMVCEFVSWSYWWIWIIPLVVSWSRLVVKQHSLGQVTLGMIVPVLVLYSVYWMVGLV